MNKHNRPSSIGKKLDHQILFGMSVVEERVRTRTQSQTYVSIVDRQFWFNSLTLTSVLNVESSYSLLDGDDISFLYDRTHPTRTT